MDHIVHINNGSGGARPIVLRLLPGEETIFNLKVVNHGEPSNVSLQASSPVIKAVRLKKPDHYVVMEEIIPILARMPANKKRLDGEILLSGSSGESRVPITLLRDSEDPGDDLEDPGPQGDEELKDDLIGNAQERENRGNDGYDNDNDDEDEDDVDADLPVRRKDSRDREDANDEDEDEDELEDEEDTVRVKRARRSEYEDEDGDGENEKEPRRIAFSRDKDLERYRSATRQRRVAGAPESLEERRVHRPLGSRVDRESELKIIEEEDEEKDDNDNSRVEARFKARIDDRFVDKSNRQQDEVPRFIPRQVPFAGHEERQESEPEDIQNERHEERQEERQEERKRATSGYEENYRGYPGSERREIPAFAGEEERERAPEEPVDYVEPDEGSQEILLDKLGGFGGLAALQVIPAALFLALVIVLVMTFITESIPEFPGALASSILIVTLIIYGAATLLKA